jgi:outer membrane cobalamin receptor
MRSLPVALAIGALCAVAVAPVYAAQLRGTVLDPARNPVAGAQVAAVNDAGVIVQQTTDDQGGFDFYVSPLYENFWLCVTAPGFATATVAGGVANIQLATAPQSDAVPAAGSAIDTMAGTQGTSTSVISSAEIRQRDEAQTVDLLRELPGVVVAQSGARGSPASVLVRGAGSNYNLAELNGIPIVSFNYGGLFDFSQMPADFIAEIQVARGPQSAVNGSYAVGSVVNFITRSPDNGPALDVLADGGTHAENHAAVSGSGMAKGWGVAASVSSLLANGPVLNSDTRADNVFLSAEHRWYTQNLFLFGDFDSNDTGEPGPYGSDPKGDYKGIDLVSRSRNNTSAYGLHYQNGLTDDLRLDVTGGFFLNNSSYLSPGGYSFNKDLRVYADPRVTYQWFHWWTLAGGFAFDREELRNTYLTSYGEPFLLRRDTEGIYLENRFVWRNRLFLNAGVREEIIQMPYLPAEPSGSEPRPVIPANTIWKTVPKFAGAYQWDPVTRLHASFGTGIRPPGGADLAFTNNPGLQPERVETYDVGIERRLMANRVSLDGTWFHNDFRDLIVGLGGSLATLSTYNTDNLGHARAEGVELTARVRPSTWILLTGNYTWLESAVLSLSGGSGLVQQYYYLGQPLVRQPKQSGSMLGTFRYGRADFVAGGYWRGHTLDVEPTYGAPGGLYRNPGYVTFNLTVNYQVRANLTAYVNLHNALDRRYEEVFGYPSPLMNVVAGLKWNLARAR